MLTVQQVSVSRPGQAGLFRSNEQVEFDWKLVHKYDPTHWALRRRNKTSGKSEWRAMAFGMSEYIAKTLCNDANRGSSCFQHQLISPIGEVFELKLP